MLFSGRRLAARPTLFGAITNTFLNTSGVSNVSTVAAFGTRVKTHKKGSESVVFLTLSPPIRRKEHETQPVLVIG